MTRTNLPLQTRLATLEEVRADNGTRIFDVVFTTGATIRRYSYVNDEMYDEELVVDTSAIRLGRLNSGAAPVLNTHSDYTLDDVLGVVMPNSARIESGVGRASLKIDGGQENEPIIRKILDGIIRNVSVGYLVRGAGILEAIYQFPVAAGRGGKRIRARAEWHFGGGSGYCRVCHEEQLPCARGECNPVTGEPCPYSVNEPITTEGFEAWVMAGLVVLSIAAMMVVQITR